MVPPGSLNCPEQLLAGAAGSSLSCCCCPQDSSSFFCCSQGGAQSLRWAQTLQGAEVALGAPQELLPALCGVPQPCIFPSSRPRLAQAVFVECCRTQGLAFLAPQSLPGAFWGSQVLLCMSTAPPTLCFAFSCTLYPSLSFTAPPRTLFQVSLWPQMTLGASPCFPEPSMGFFESLHLHFWAPQGPPYDFSHALQPSLCFSLHSRSLCPALGAPPEASPCLLPQGDMQRGGSRAAKCSPSVSAACGAGRVPS